MAQSPLDAVLRRLEARTGTPASKEGRGFKTLCPAHDDREPSLSVTDGEDGRVLLRCFARCSVKAVVQALGLTMADLFPSRNTRPEGRREVRAERRPRVGQLLAATRPDAGRLAAYLRHRGLRGDVPPVLRFHPALRYIEDGKARTFPAMVAAVVNGTVVAAHRTYLDRTNDGKASVPTPKKSLGPVKGGAIRLVEAGETLALAEGIETALAVYEATGTPAWSVVSAGNMACVRVPEEVRAVELWADGDAAGRDAAEETARRHHGEGRTVFVMVAPDGRDWLDVLVAEGPEALRRARAKASAWEPSDGLVADEHLTDLGNARRLVAAHGRDLRYSPAWATWFVWDGKRWARDDSLEVVRRAKAAVRQLYADAMAVADLDRRGPLVKHALRTESAARLMGMVTLAQSEPSIPVHPDQLDTDPWVLNVANGTLDLRTGQLRPHRRDEMLTKLAPVVYDSAAPSPAFTAFLDRIFAGNPDLITFVQRAAGYSLTGQTGERVFFILWGVGANGKSTLLEVLRTMLGDYAMRTPTETLLVKREGAIPNDVARLKGARFVTASEADEGKRLGEALIKDLTGNETISARFMRAEWFDFKPEFKLWLSTNHKPVIRGTDKAIWDRIRLVPFTVRIPDAEQDKQLGAKLRAELPGILRWVVDGCLAWQRDGLGMPAEVEEATAAYRAEMDLLAQFIEDACVVDAKASTTAKYLHAAYQGWCEANGERALTQKALGDKLRERGFEPRKAGKGRRVWDGIGVADGWRVAQGGATSDMTDENAFMSRSSGKTRHPSATRHPHEARDTTADKTKRRAVESSAHEHHCPDCGRSFPCTAACAGKTVLCVCCRLDKQVRRAARGSLTGDHSPPRVPDGNGRPPAARRGPDESADSVVEIPRRLGERR